MDRRGRFQPAAVAVNYWMNFNRCPSQEPKLVVKIFWLWVKILWKFEKCFILFENFLLVPNNQQQQQRDVSPGSAYEKAGRKPTPHKRHRRRGGPRDGSPLEPGDAEFSPTGPPEVPTYTRGRLFLAPHQQNQAGHGLGKKNFSKNFRIGFEKLNIFSRGNFSKIFIFSKNFSFLVFPFGFLIWFFFNLDGLFFYLVSLVIRPTLFDFSILK